VVTFTPELCEEVPAASVAETLKVYVVEGERLLTVNEVLDVDPIELPF
jgi:hypothetical protein